MMPQREEVLEEQILNEMKEVDRVLEPLTKEIKLYSIHFTYSSPSDCDDDDDLIIIIIINI